MRTGIYVVLAVVLMVPAAAWSQASGGHTQPFAATGLGLPGGSANLSLDSAWRVSAYAKSGIRYLQIEDMYGSPRAAVAYVGDAIWALPVGPDVDRVSTPDEPFAMPTGAVRRVIYLSEEIELAVYEAAGKTYWEVRKP